MGIRFIHIIVDLNDIKLLLTFEGSTLNALDSAKRVVRVVKVSRRNIVIIYLVICKILLI
jgi:hypothetical protein